MWQRKIFSTYRNKTIKQFYFIVLVLFLVRVPYVLAEYDIVESEIYLQSAEEKKAEAQKVFRAQLKLAAESDIPILSIPLDPLSEQERETIQSAIEGQNTKKKKKIGIGRSVPSPYCDVIDPSLYQWLSLPEGGRAAVFSVESPEAMALRAKIKILNMPKKAELRFYNPANPEEVYGPYLIDQIRNQMVEDSFWSPVIENSSMAIEIFLPKGLDSEDLLIAVPQISHLWSSILNSRGYSRLSEIGASGYCNINVACTDWSGSYEERSVAKMIFTKVGSTYACTGTALNDRDPSTQIPYFLTANHCVSTQAAASTLITYWNFQKSSCYGPNPSMVIQRTGGAKLLSTGRSPDYTLLQLYQDLPSGGAFAGWTSATVNSGTHVVGIHHPQGDLKKISFGTTSAFCNYLSYQNYSNGPYVRVYWTRGITEGGSSGSALFDNQGHVIGILRGGYASCQAPSAPDWCSRFDLIFPSISQWLSDAPPMPTPAPSPYPNPSPTPVAKVFLSDGNYLSYSDSLTLKGFGQPDLALAGDFNGDGKYDFLWYETWTGVAKVFLSDGNYLSYSDSLTLKGFGQPDLALAGDFNGDGKDDLLWYENW
jgi:hypothetical protein